MEPEGSLTHSQMPAICSYPEPSRSSPSPQIPLPEDPSLILSFHLRFGLQSGSFSSDFPTKIMYTSLPSPTRATFLAHLILLDFITRKVLGKNYRSLGSSTCSLLHSPVISSLLGPNILLSTLFSNTLSPRASYAFARQYIETFYCTRAVLKFPNPLRTANRILILKAFFLGGGHL